MKQNHANATRITREFCGVSQPKGVSWYVARIQSGKKKAFLGCFKTKEAARDAYIEASRLLRGDFSAV